MAFKDIHYTPLQKLKQHSTTGRSKTRSTVTCYRCLGDHLANACKFRTTECYLCKKLKVGHIAKACKSKQKGKKSQQFNSKTNHYVEEDEITTAPKEHNRDSDTSYGMFTVEGNSLNPIVVQVDINQVPVEMEVDTITHQQSYL